ncbi:hypothetical protein [Undibacterium sp. TS12]|uniref:hypothetical protein n=1 Tax=Undibacterium sp. TS12 TaxID=2908202 RepID=UPI001F4C7C08|nr:hypothetical protein [Undibacterium sp. TS12]MCH8620747.1 hypothetical protein [Undibacterium sp. TS12]
MNTFKYLIAVASSVLVNLAGAEEVLKCRASFPDFGNGKHQFAIQIDKSTDGTMKAMIDGKPANQDITMKDYPVSRDLDFEIDTYSTAYGKLNEAETSLVHIYKLQHDPRLAEKTSISFPLKEVIRIHFYDLVGGKPNKFGGTVLFEAYDKSGKLLGRVFRSMMVADCI